MSLLYGSARKIIDKSACSRWQLADDEEGGSHGVCEMKWGVTKGRYMSSLVYRAVGESLISEAPIVTQVCGMHFNRVCFACNFIGLKKACVSEDCKHIFFCSRRCVAKEGPFLSLCGQLINNIVSRIQPAFKDHALLLVRMLYLFKIGRIDLSQVFDMDICVKAVDNELNAAAVVFNRACLSKETAILSDFVSQEKITKLLRAIKFNAQSLLIPSLPSTYFLCLFGVASKFNHSCRPNVKIIYGVSDSSLIAAVVAIAPVEPGDQLCISYINALNLRISDRQTLLLRGFCFQCNCDRCYGELQAPLKYNVPFNGTKSELSRIRHWCAAVNSIEKCSLEDIAEISNILVCQLENMSATVEIESFNRGKVSVYDISDLSVATLQRLKVLMSSSTTNPQRTVVLVIRTCSILSFCWTSLSGTYSTEKLNILMLGLSYVYRQAGSALDCVDDSTRKLARGMVADALSILRLEALMLRKGHVGEGTLEVLHKKMFDLCNSLSAVL